MEKPRYFVTDPTPGGYRYFDVRDGDQNNPGGPNFSVATIWSGMANAKHVAERIARDLNDGRTLERSDC